MPHWTICFDATITASVEASSSKEAVESAERTLEAIGVDGLLLGESARYSIGRAFMIRDEQTGVEIRK